MPTGCASSGSSSTKGTATTSTATTMTTTTSAAVTNAEKTDKVKTAGKSKAAALLKNKAELDATATQVIGIYPDLETELKGGKSIAQVVADQ